MADLPDWLERLLRPRPDGVPAVLIGTDGAMLPGGEVLALTEYERRYGKQAHRAIKVEGLHVRE